MDEIRLAEPTQADAERIAEYRAEFPRNQVTCDPDRIPGLDGLEDFDSVADWLRYCESMRGKITWYMAVRNSDDRIVGFCCLRHRLEYDDDEGEFASHIGYSVRMSERRKGYAEWMLRAALPRCRELGLERILITCLETNEASRRTILSCGGVYESTVFEPDRGRRLQRYWIDLKEDGRLP